LVTSGISLVETVEASVPHRPSQFLSLSPCTRGAYVDYPSWDFPWRTIRGQMGVYSNRN